MVVVVDVVVDVDVDVIVDVDVDVIVDVIAPRDRDRARDSGTINVFVIGAVDRSGIAALGCTVPATNTFAFPNHERGHDHGE